VTSLFVPTAFLVHAPGKTQGSTQRAKQMAARALNPEIMFPWARLGIFEDLFFEPTPGPGDSEGGDVFSPAMAAAARRPAAQSD
jgi:hypothetical protein